MGIPKLTIARRLQHSG